VAFITQSPVYFIYGQKVYSESIIPKKNKPIGIMRKEITAKSNSFAIILLIILVIIFVWLFFYGGFNSLMSMFLA
jgi:hypothetical protein